MNAIIPSNGGNALIPTNMEGAMRLAEMMARGRLVPSHLHSQPGDCLMVIEQAMRWGMSPFAVAQCTSVIQGKLMYEGKLVAAAVQTSGVLDGRLSYSFAGEGDARTITVRGMIRGEKEPREIEVRLKDAKTNNQQWTKQPDQQLVYYGTRAWARRHTPEVMLGVYSPEEFDPPQRDTFAGTTIDAEPVTRTQAQTDTARAIGDSLPPHSSGEAGGPIQAPKRTLRQFIDDTVAALEVAKTKDDVDRIVFTDEMDRARAMASNGNKERLEAAIMTAQTRTADDDFPGTVTREAAE